MASIPSCAAYQASYIHAHMRRQNMTAQQRARHPSTASTDSTTSDPPLTPVSAPQAPFMSQGGTANTQPHSAMNTALAQPAGQPAGQGVSMREHMDRVSQWVADGLGFKKWIPPYTMVPSNVTVPADMERFSSVPDNVGAHPSTTLTSGHMVKSDD